MRRGGGIGRCEAQTGKAAFGRLVAQVRAREPDRSARRLFWVVDQGRRPRGATAAREVQARYPTRILVQRPTQAAWLNPSAISCSLGQRTVLTPNEFADLAAVQARLLAVATRYTDTARPFAWRFPRAPLEDRLAHLAELLPVESPLPQAA